MLDLDAIAAAALALDPECVSPVDRAREEWQSFTAENFAGSHAPQLAFTRDRSPFIHVMCARQSGKTWGDDGIMYGNAQDKPRSTNLFLGIKGTGVRLSNWVPIWQQGVCERYGLPAGCHNETSMLTTFPNESRVMLAGTDDLTNIKKYLGNRLDNGVVIIDEAQDQPGDVLKYILTVLLPPMLTPTTRVILSGVLPDVGAGYFLSLARYDEESKTGGAGPGWSHHEWGRAANVHTPEAMEQLQSYCKLHNIPLTDPQIQRDWYMRRVWNASATAYRYSRACSWAAPTAIWNVTVPPGVMRATSLPPGVDTVSVGVDPGGAADRFAIVAVGWNSRRPTELWHLAEWVTPKGTLVSWDTASAVLDIFAAHLPIAYYHYDAGGSSNELALFSRVSGRFLLKAAAKSDLHGQVEHVANLCASGRFHVIAGSALEHDLEVSAWDQNELAAHRHKWSSAHHPDPADAARYAAQPFFALADAAPVVKTEEERIDEMMRAQVGSQREDHTANDLPGDLMGGYGNV